MGSQRRDAGVDRDLGSRSRLEIQLAQEREVEADGGGRLYSCTGGPRPEEGGESDVKSGAARSKFGG